MGEGGDDIHTPTTAVWFTVALLGLGATGADAWPRHLRHHRAASAHYARPHSHAPAHGDAGWHDPARSRITSPGEREARRGSVPRRRQYTVPSSTIRVHDGDTFSSGAETIRLRGIDTPEVGQPESFAATRRLTALLNCGPVTIVPRVEDVYGRTVADVYACGQNVADVLRREGFQKPSTGKGI